MSAHPDFDQIASTTLDNYRAKLTDNFFSATPLMDALKRRDRVRFLGGGANIIEPLMTGDNSTAKPYSGWDVLDITPQAGISAATFPWKQFAVSVAINGIEEAVNSGEQAVVDLLEAKITQAELSAVDGFATMAQGDGTTYRGVANTKAWDGLGRILGTGAVGGIDPAVAGNEFWLPVRVDGGGEFVDDSKWAQAYYTASNAGTDAPDLGFTTQDIYVRYEDYLGEKLRFTSNSEADSRFENLLFKGVRIHMDPYVPEGTTQFLNTKYFGMAVLKNKWMKNTKFRETPDVDGRWCQILSYGNFTVRNRQRHAVVYNQVAVTP